MSLLEWNVVIWQLLHDTGYRLIAYDHRGHGQSTLGAQGIGSVQMAGDVKAILDYFDVRDGVLVGHSMGGFLAVGFMLTHPEAASARLKHCLLLGSHAGDVLRGAPQNRLQIALLKDRDFAVVGAEPDVRLGVECRDVRGAPGPFGGRDAPPDLGGTAASRPADFTGHDRRELL